MLISIIIPSYCRAELLNFCLYSLARQNIDIDLETIILNDGQIDNTEVICNKYNVISDKLNIRHIFTGHRNSHNLIRRNPAFPLNIGIQQSLGDIIILTCPEMFHLNDSLNIIINPLLNNDNIISIPEYIFHDKNGEALNIVRNNLEDIYLHEWINKKLKVDNIKHMKYAATNPFFLALHKKHIMNIRGYDEDLIGIGADDDDLMGRLRGINLQYHRTNSLVIHLYHNKLFNEHNKMYSLKYLYNLNKYNKRKGQIIRNINREWGKL